MATSTQDPYTVELSREEGVLMTDILLGTVTAVNSSAKTVDVTLSEPYTPRTSQTNYGKLQNYGYAGIEDNPITDLTDVPIVYNCRGANENPSAAFSINDVVLILASDGSYFCTGFPSTIKECGVYLVVTIGTYCFVWNTGTQDFMDIPGITFPCLCSELNDFLSDKTSIGTGLVTVLEEQSNSQLYWYEYYNVAVDTWGIFCPDNDNYEYPTSVHTEPYSPYYCDTCSSSVSLYVKNGNECTYCAPVGYDSSITFYYTFNLNYGNDCVNCKKIDFFTTHLYQDWLRVADRRQDTGKHAGFDLDYTGNYEYHEGIGSYNLEISSNILYSHNIWYYDQQWNDWPYCNPPGFPSYSFSCPSCVTGTTTCVAQARFPTGDEVSIKGIYSGELLSYFIMWSHGFGHFVRGDNDYECWDTKEDAVIDVAFFYEELGSHSDITDINPINSPRNSSLEDMTKQAYNAWRSDLGAYESWESILPSINIELYR